MVSTRFLSLRPATAEEVAVANAAADDSHTVGQALVATVLLSAPPSLGGNPDNAGLYLYRGAAVWAAVQGVLLGPQGHSQDAPPFDDAGGPYDRLA